MWPQVQGSGAGREDGAKEDTKVMLLKCGRRGDAGISEDAGKFSGEMCMGERVDIWENVGDICPRA